ncbi:hypothetical protein CN138_08925 [Sinorhizobium meliloti]|nr:hypothetical protein CN138_08925 [Sinorhizobium meliloti]
MARKVEKGSRVLLAGTVTRIGEDGMISVRLRGIATPVTLYVDDIEEVGPAEKDKPQRRPRNFYDNPEREE